MAFRQPYTRDVNVYSPQRSAGLGRRAELPEEYSLAYNRLPIPRIQPQAMVDEPALSELPLAEEMIFGGGPGVGAFGGEATANPSAVTTGLVSPNTANAIEGAFAKGLGFQKGEQGYVPSVSSIMGVPGLLANPLVSLAIKGGKEAISFLNEQLGNPWGKAKDAFVNALGLGQGEAPNLGFEGMSIGDPNMIGSQSVDPNLGQDPFGLEANAPMSHGEPDMGPPPSSLADIGIGPAPGGNASGVGFGFGGYGQGY